MIFMIVAVLVVPGMDALSKMLTDWMSPGQIALLRLGMQTLVLGGALVWRRDLRWPDGGPRMLVNLAVAGLFIAGSILSMIWALSVLPLANAIAIFFVEPLILTLFSALFLGERVGWRRVAAVTVGLCGAVVVIRPNWAAFGWHALLPLATATFMAAYLSATRHLGARLGGLVLQTWAGGFAGLFAALALGAGLVFGLEPLSVGPIPTVAWPLLVGLGLLASVAHLMLTLAFRRAEASLLAPFQYLEIISATALGYLIFGDFPDALTWTGVAIILASGLYVFHREGRAARRERRAEPVA